MATFPIIPWTQFYLMSSPTIPSFYWDVYSDEQRIKTLCCMIHKLTEYTQTLTDGENQTASELERLQGLFEEFQTGGFYNYYEEALETWIYNNLEFIMQVLIKQVYFGLNEQGYFVAYVPESWSDIIFDTGMDYSLDTYGRLILRFDVDSPTETVNQTPEERS